MLFDKAKIGPRDCYATQGAPAGIISATLAAAALKIFTPKAFKVAQNLTAFNPRTRRCLTPVRRLYSDIVASTPARHL